MECESCSVCRKPQGVVCWCDEKNRKFFCKTCLVSHLNEPGVHVVLGGKVRFGELGGMWEKVRNFEGFREFVRDRIERLGFLRDKGVMEIWLAGEELKRMIDREIEKIGKGFREDCDECERRMMGLIGELGENKNKVVRIGSKDLVNVEPLELELITEPVFEAVSGMVRYKLSGLEEADEKLVFFSDGFQELTIFTPRSNQLTQASKQKLRIFKNSAVCYVPNDWVYIAGGQTRSSCSSLCQKFRITRSRVFEVQALNNPRHSFAMVNGTGCIYAFGGKNNEGKVLNSCEKFLMTTKEWVNLSGMGEGKYDLSIAKVNEFIFLCGKGSDKVEKFDCLSEEFTSLIERREVLRLLPSIDTGLILLCNGVKAYVDCENGDVLDEERIDETVWGGTCCPIVKDSWVYFDVGQEIWKFNLFSKRIVLNQT